MVGGFGCGCGCVSLLGVECGVAFSLLSPLPASVDIKFKEPSHSKAQNRRTRELALLGRAAQSPSSSYWAVTRVSSVENTTQT